MYLSNPRTHVRQRSSVNVIKLNLEERRSQDEAPLLNDVVKSPTTVPQRSRFTPSLVALWALSLAVVSIVTYFLASLKPHQSFVTGYNTELRKYREVSKPWHRLIRKAQTARALQSGYNANVSPAASTSRIDMASSLLAILA